MTARPHNQKTQAAFMPTYKHLKIIHLHEGSTVRINTDKSLGHFALFPHAAHLKAFLKRI